MRYKEYNVNRVLEKSIDLFWQKGFNGCSVNEIVESTGVNRFSLYHEFGNKEGILYSSLKLYRDRYCDEKLSLLHREGELIVVLKDFLLAFLEGQAPKKGCYFIHIGTELADSDLRVKEIVDSYLKEINDLFVSLLMKHGFETEEAELRSRHLLGLYCTAVSFSLIHSRDERENYVTNGLNVLLN